MIAGYKDAVLDTLANCMADKRGAYFVDENAALSQVASLTEELELSRGGIRDQLKEKDAKINSLVEELGNSQAMLNDKVAELAEVPCWFPPCCPECAVDHRNVDLLQKLHVV